jgi:DUF4097 and DUF4098 domain-containing protein YvlB
MVVAVSLQAEEIDESRDVQADGLIKIEILRGEIEIKGWSETRVQIKGELDELAEGLRFEVREGVTKIEVEMPSKHVNWGDGSDLVIETLSGDIDTEARLVGYLRGASISGDVMIEAGFSQNVSAELTTVSGDIGVSIDGPLDLKFRVNSNSGDIGNGLSEVEVVNEFGVRPLQGQVGSGAGSLAVRSVSGAIELEEG